VERGRFQVAGLLGCDAREVVFMSGGTESDNAAIQGVLYGARPERKLIVTSTVEHSAVREPLGWLRKRGYEVVEVGVDVGGRLDMEGLERVLAERAQEIALVTVMWVNNETGVIFDVGAIGRMCRERGVLFHVDGVQAVGKLPIRLRELPIDLMSVSGHKFHGPKGVGALYVRRGVRWQSFVRGGPQERERRGGTENVAGIVGMGVAAELAMRAVEDGEVMPRVAALRDRLERSILDTVPESSVNGDVSRRVVNTTNIGFSGLEAEAILILLSEAEICASAGAACASGSLEPSHVLRAMEIDEKVAHGAVRFSLSKWTTEVEVDRAVEVVGGVVKRLRETLPV
jgi:cysteine desulfurase